MLSILSSRQPPGEMHPQRTMTTDAVVLKP
jgi:hypothetical protein